MEREIRVTEDGSNTLYIKNLEEGYHSNYGALQEAEHVFIKNGIKKLNCSEINILELGFGTGLNFLVTLKEFLNHPNLKKIHYFTIEKYPITNAEIQALHYNTLFNNPLLEDLYFKSHLCNWDSTIEIYPNFYFTKFNIDFFEVKKLNLPPINLVYFDCFSSKIQPDLWEKPLFEMLADKMSQEALLTTYSSKGSVKRILQDLHFRIEKLEGPKGKREMINAIKL